MGAEPFKDVDIGVDYAVCVWENLGMNSEGAPKDVRGYRHTTAQVVGDPSGALVDIQGAILDNHFETLFDVSTIQSSAHDVLQIKPKVSGGDKNTKVTVAVICRR